MMELLSTIKPNNMALGLQINSSSYPEKLGLEICITKYPSCRPAAYIDFPLTIHKSFGLCMTPVSLQLKVQLALYVYNAGLVKQMQNDYL